MALKYIYNYFPITATNIISSIISSPSNSSSTSNYTTTPNHQSLSVSNYDSHSPIQVQSASHSRRQPNRNHNKQSARSTPNLPTATPVHNYQSPSFATQSNQPIITSPGEIGQTNQNYYRNVTASASHTSSKRQPVNVTTHQIQSFLSSSTVSSMSAASIAASRDPFTGVANSSHQVSPTSPPGYNNSQSSTSQLARVEEKVSGRGITRSSASYGIQQLLQEQVSYHIY